MDSDKALKVLVDIGVIGKDKLDEARKALEQVKTGTGEAGNEARKGAEGFKEFAGKSGELRRAFTELHHEFPEAALALRALTNPVGGAITIGILAFVAMKHALDEQNKAMDEAMARYADPTFIEAIKARKEALDEFRLSFEKFQDDLAHTTTEQQALDQEYAFEATALKRLAESQQQYNDVAESLDMDNIEALHKLGLTSDTDYFNQKIQIEEKYRKQKRDLEIQDLQEQASRDNTKLQSALFGVYGTGDEKHPMGGLYTAAQASHKASEKAQEKLDSSKAELSKLESGDKALMDAMTLATEADEAYRRLSANGFKYMGTERGRADLSTLSKSGDLMTWMGGADSSKVDEEMRVAVQDAMGSFQRIQALKGAIPGQADAAQAAAAQAERDKAAVTNAQKVIDDLGGQFGKVQDELDAVSAKRSSYARVENMENLHDYDTSGSDLPAEVRGAVALAKGGRYSQQQAQALVNMADVLTGQNLNLAQAAAYFRKNGENNDALLELMKAAFQKILQHEDWIKSLRPMITTGG